MLCVMMKNKLKYINKVDEKIKSRGYTFSMRSYNVTSAKKDKQSNLLKNFEFLFFRPIFSKTFLQVKETVQNMYKYENWPYSKQS